MIQALRMLARERTEELRIAGVVLGIIVLLVAMGEHFVRTPATLLAMIAVIGAGVLVLVNMRLALFLFVAFLVSYEEFNLSSQEAFVEENIANTVLAVKVFGFAVMDVVSLLLLLPVLVREWAHALRAGAGVFFPPTATSCPCCWYGCSARCMVGGTHSPSVPTPGTSACSDTCWCSTSSSRAYFGRNGIIGLPCCWQVPCCSRGKGCFYGAMPAAADWISEDIHACCSAVICRSPRCCCA